MYSKFPIDLAGLSEVTGGWRMFVLGETTLIFFFLSKAVSVSESENGHTAFSEQVSVEDAAMPAWERPFWHSSHCGWDGSGDTGLPS